MTNTLDVSKLTMAEIEQLSQKELNATYDVRYSYGLLTEAEMNAA